MASHAHGFNGSLTTRNLGTRAVRIGTIDYGLEIIAQQGEASQRQAFYPSAYDGSGFSISVLFMDWEERETFSRWLRAYMEKVLRGHGFYASMTVRCPVRDFVRVGIPQDQIDYGEALTDVGYSMGLNFLGVTDPADPRSSTLHSGVSYFKWPKNDKQTKFFYPASKQLAGAASMEGTIFDTTGDMTNATVAEHDLPEPPGNATVADR